VVCLIGLRESLLDGLSHAVSEFSGDAAHHLHTRDDPCEFFDRWLEHVVNNRPTR
jgi:hypothetical protein